MRMLQNKYNVLKGTITAKLKSVDRYCLTTDVWTDVTNHLGVTFHHLSQDLKMENQILGVHPLHTSHTAQELSNALMEVLSSFELDTKNLTAIVTDCGSNIRKAVNS